MIFFKAQRLQRLAEQLMELQRRLESEGGDTTHIREGLQELAHRVGVDLDIVRLATPDTVLDVITAGGGGDPGKIWVVGEILYLDGVRALAEGNEDEARGVLTSARKLLQALGSRSVSLPDNAVPPNRRLDELENLLDD